MSVTTVRVTDEVRVVGDRHYSCAHRVILNFIAYCYAQFLDLRTVAFIAGLIAFPLRL